MAKEPDVIVTRKTGNIATLESMLATPEAPVNGIRNVTGVSAEQEMPRPDSVMTTAEPGVGGGCEKTGIVL